MSKETTRERSYVLEIIKVIVVAIIISLVAILVMSFLIKLLSIKTETISIIIQVIKGVSILVGCLLCLKNPNNGWLRGIIAGILYVIIAFVIFSLLDGSKFSFELSLLNDVALGAVSGMVSGIIAVSIRK